MPELDSTLVAGHERATAAPRLPAFASALLLDLDGTLVDSVPLHTLAWWRALDEAHHTVPMSTIQPLVGMGGADLLHELIGCDDEAVKETHQQAFESMRALVRPLPGAHRLLTRARQVGIRCYVVTSSNRENAEWLLKLFPEGAVDGIVHGGEVAHPKPAPDLFQLALDRWNLEPAAAVAVGDAEWDVRAGSQAGLRTVGLLTGGTPADRLLQAGALAVFRSCSELAGFV